MSVIVFGSGVREIAIVKSLLKDERLTIEEDSLHSGPMVYCYGELLMLM